jgi:hypothetical protein
MLGWYNQTNKKRKQQVLAEDVEKWKPLYMAAGVQKQGAQGKMGEQAVKN